MFSGLFQTLLVPTRTPAEQETDAAAANGSPVVDAPTPAADGVISPPATASELPLDGAAGNGAVTVERHTGANPVVPAAIALAAILAGVGVVLAYPGHHHRSSPRKAVAPPTTTVTGPARGAIAPIASAAALTLDLTNAKAVGAIVPILKKRAPAKPAAKPASSTGGSSSSGAASGSGSDTTQSNSSQSGSGSTPQKKASSTPAKLAATPKWTSVKGTAATLSFSFTRNGGKGTVDQLQLVVSSGTTGRVAITSFKVGKPFTNKCTIASKFRPNDMLRCTGLPLRVGSPYSLTVTTDPAEQGDIAFLGRLYGRIDGKTYGPFETP